jgi:hypothetical protein
MEPFLNEFSPALAASREFAFRDSPGRYMRPIRAASAATGPHDKLTAKDTVCNAMESSTRVFRLSVTTPQRFMHMFL